MLRPLIQDTLFPVVATVCGPGEVSYFAQIGSVYEYLGIKLPVIYPRFSATVIENKIEKLLKKYRMTDILLSTEKDDVVKLFLRDNKSEKTEVLIENMQEGIDKKIMDAENKIKSFGIDTENNFDRIKRNVNKEIGVLKKKLYAKSKRQSQHTMDDIDKLYLNIFPEGNLQERMVNIFFYMNKHGISMIKDLYDAFLPLDGRHRFLYFNRSE